MIDASEHFRARLTAEIVENMCQGPLPEAAIAGLRLFNEKRYFEAHEALETAWRAEPGPIRELYRGVLQVGVGYYNIQRQKYNGALKMFTSCRRWLDPYPDTCRGVNIRKLYQDFQRVESELIRLGPERIALFDQSLFQPVEYSS